MHPDVKNLVNLQKVDQKIARIRKDLDSLPKEREKREKDLNRLRADLEVKQTKFQEGEVSVRTNETGIKHCDAELKKLTERLNVVKNNAEYQATLLAIESVKKEQEILEEEGLVLLEQVEGDKELCVAAEAVLAGEQKIFDEFLVQAEALMAERQVQVDAASQGRDDLAEQIPAELFEKYTRMFHARAHVSVAEVEGGTCMGCYISIPPNLMVKLQAGSSVVHCDACQRILYIPE